jgi:hypothetical protein
VETIRICIDSLRLASTTARRERSRAPPQADDRHQQAEHRRPEGARPEDAYQPDDIEAKWQARWAERHVNEPDLDRAERPFYNLMMFPYPSAEGLHVGNVFAFTGSDAYFPSPVTSRSNRGFFRSGSNVGSILSQPGDRR